MVNVSPRIAFMFLPAGDLPFFSHHLGVAYIQALLKTQDISSCQLIPPPASNLADCADALVATNAPIIGLTCYDSNFHLVRCLADLVKAKRPDRIIVAGGPTATFSDDLLMTYAPGVDICVRYEGEKACLELVFQIIDGKPIDGLDDIQGITFHRNGQFIRTPNREPLGLHVRNRSELDDLPSPYIEGILDGTEDCGLISSRGCVHRCTYCNFTAMSQYVIRYHSVDRVIDELRVIQRGVLQSGIEPSLMQTISFRDDALTLDPKRAKAICRRIIAEGIQLPLSCLCRADNLDDELIELFKEAHFVEVSFGLESAVPKVLRNVKKVCARPALPSGESFEPERKFLARVKSSIERAKHLGMRTSVSIILGLPGETREEGFKTVDFVRELNPDYCAHNYLVAFPGTEIFDTADQWGIKVSQSNFILPYHTRHSYPVHEIAPFTISSMGRAQRMQARMILRAIAGECESWHSGGRGVTQAILPISGLDALERSSSWLSETLSVQGTIVILGSVGGQPDDFAAVLEVFARQGTPTQEYAYLSEDKNSDFTYHLIRPPGFSSEICFPFVQPSKRLSHGFERVDISKHWLIYDLQQELDVLILWKLAEESNVPAVSNASFRLGWLDGVVLDGCRWANRTCPATHGRRVVINEAGEVSPCLTGKPLTNLTHSIDEMRRRGQKRLQDVMRERHCEECSVKNVCSKCLFPYPISVAEFCEIRRACPSIGALIGRSVIGNALHLLAHEGF